MHAHGRRDGIPITVPIVRSHDELVIDLGAFTTGHDAGRDGDEWVLGTGDVRELVDIVRQLFPELNL